MVCALVCAQVDWPLSIVIGRRSVQQYQLAFRHLAELKWAERDLTGVWQVYQATRALYRYAGREPAYVHKPGIRGRSAGLQSRACIAGAPTPVLI